ncbi:MAG: hypothetical protein K5895_08305 [Lachnospiraceae bacterium]|jgi:heme A synthase|nr:hypothetical protein [Lachnospiraceae bacterium]
MDFEKQQERKAHRIMAGFYAFVIIVIVGFTAWKNSNEENVQSQATATPQVTSEVTASAE